MAKTKIKGSPLSKDSSMEELKEWLKLCMQKRANEWYSSMEELKEWLKPLSIAFVAF